MKLSEAYRMAIEIGMDNDPRGRAAAEKELEEARKAHAKLEGAEKEVHDEERLWNPYADSRFSWGDGDVEAERLLWGIDIGTGEMVLADRLRERGEKVSAVVGHHPLGLARTPFPEVMGMQSDMYHGAGIPINVCEGLMGKRMEEVSRAVLGSNYNQSVDAARLLGIPLMNVHTPADNCVQKFFTDFFEEKDPRTLKEIIDGLMGVPEVREAARWNSPPKIIAGSGRNRAGKIVVKMTGGTSGPKEIYEKMAQSGIGTAVGMHFPESHVEEAKKNHVNLVVSGHMASDSIGMNVIADAWEREGIEVTPFSGFIRVSRN
ncbi:MAG: hypothetical protein GX224_04735 [Thermoplasmatales archaeon]|nr:hypothetical protein [Thermoplasmatales archaeon]